MGRGTDMKGHQMTLEDMLKVAEAATPGTWYLDVGEAAVRIDSTREVICQFDPHEFGNTLAREPDGFFISTFNPEVVKKLLGALQELREAYTVVGHYEWCKDVFQKLDKDLESQGR